MIARFMSFYKPGVTKGVAAEPTCDEGWNTSKCSQSDLDTMVSQGLLVPRSII